MVLTKIFLVMLLGHCSCGWPSGSLSSFFNLIFFFLIFLLICSPFNHLFYSWIHDFKCNGSPGTVFYIGASDTHAMCRLLIGYSNQPASCVLSRLLASALALRQPSARCGAASRGDICSSIQLRSGHWQKEKESTGEEEKEWSESQTQAGKR